jgi:sigma-B regulation protein RsbU (phosphoserine phosphatase)
VRRFLLVSYILDRFFLSYAARDSDASGSQAGRHQTLRPHMTKVIAIVLALSFSLSARAEKEIITVNNWRMHAGDNPAWSKPDFDDSQWTKIDFDSGQMNSFGFAAGASWYRAAFQVPAGFAAQNLAIGVGPIGQVYEVYVNGVRVGGYGSWLPAPHAPFPRHMVFPIPPGLLKGPVGHIAIHRWRGSAGLEWLTFALSGYMKGDHAPEIGPRGAVDALERLHLATGAIRNLPWDLTFVLFLFAAVISFVLYSVQRRRLEYLYLGIYCALWGGPPLIAIPVETSNSIMGQSWGPALIFFLAALSGAFQFLFLATLCARFRNVLKIGVILSAFASLIAAYSLAEQSHLAALLWISWASYATWLFILLAAWGCFQERNRGSLSIAICLLLSAAVWGWGTAALRYQLPGLNIPAGPFQIDVRSVPGVLFVFVTLLVLYLRYRNEQARQAAIDQDLAAGRRMQEQLLAGSEKAPAGFEVEAIYRPAREVGGDFFRTVSLEDGSLLVILGDVSGKGLDAAMLVAVILGCLANETGRGPASLLAYLNRAVMGRTAGGFITACCARFYPGGRVVFANAGQIAPYVEGREVQIENGLPLGISADTTYDETEITTDGAVTFVSDGVVEARDAKGELLGFERMAALTKRRAAEIAEAAQRWGQEDDITVLTVARAPKLEPISA